MKALIYTFFLFAILILGSCRWKAPQEIQSLMAELPQTIDFNYHVKPILSDKCFACHGPDMANQKAGLRLDIAENAYEVLKSSGKHPIVPGKPGQSEVIDRILSDDPEIKMPPPEFKVELSKNEIAILTRWVEQGAEYKQHWSFIKPKKEKIPQFSSKDWANNEIDAFVAAKLEEHKLTASERASKENLIRRLSFDLTGLPPTLNEINGFVNDTTPKAYEKLVDRLLASPAYGERMASDWMDVASYAESDGYLDDKHRDFSAYRDWVINSYNDNMPYDQFVTWQLAGDLLQHPTKESILATAFNRLHKKNSEAGIVFEEYRVEYVADRTLTVGRAFLGVSMECARCHDHKYDPISQKDHYEMFAFFNSTNELGTAVYGPGQVPGPSLLLTNNEQDKLLEYIDNKIFTAEERLGEAQKLDIKNGRDWIANTGRIEDDINKALKKGLVADYRFDRLVPYGEKTFSIANLGSNANPAFIKEPKIEQGETGKGVFLNDYTTITLPKKVGWFDQSDPFSISVSIFPDKNYDEAALFTHCEDIRLGMKGYSLHLENNHPKFIIARSWPYNAIQVKTKNPIAEKEWSNLTVTYDGLGKAEGVHIYLNGKLVPVEIEADNLYKSILYMPDIHTYGFKGFAMGVRDKMKTFINGGIDNLKIYDRELSALEVLYDRNKQEALAICSDPKAGGNEKFVLDFYHKSIDPETERKRKELQRLRKDRIDELEPIQEIMVLGDMLKPRPTYILDRGAYDAPTEQVLPDVPQAIMPFGEDMPRNRLGLAKWLFNKNHPLTARVYVNRLWQQHFGKGLVASSDDFGNQGDLPTHPELLDWLAVQFIESGWDIKNMHKLMVMSATYQQSSEIRPELLAIDVENNLLARGSSVRMTAEMVRDNALAISGLLSKKIGGPSAYPYQPEGLWDELSDKGWRYKYMQEPGEGLYRRSLYTIWKRTSGPPSMQIFDVGDRSVCTVKRRQTSTPLQALVLLNDPQFVEASYIVAEKLLHEVGDNLEKCLIQAFQLCTGRYPLEEELKVLENFHDDELVRFSAIKNDAIAYLDMGETKVRSSSDPVQVAALATVINGIMNTSEGYTIR